MQIDVEKARDSYKKLPRGTAFNAIAIVQDALLDATQRYMTADAVGLDDLALRHLTVVYSLCHVKRQMVQAA